MRAGLRRQSDEIPPRTELAKLTSKVDAVVIAVAEHVQCTAVNVHGNESMRKLTVCGPPTYGPAVCSYARATLGTLSGPENART